MGLFSSKSRIYVGTSVVRVIDDVSIPDATTTGVVKSIFNSGDMPEHIMEEMISSIGVRAERMYDYAVKKYTHGLPSGQVFASTRGREEVAAVLTGLEGRAIVLDYCQFGPPNSLHMGWMKIIDLYGYNAQTNQLPVLSAQKGYPVYLDDMRVVVPDVSIGSFEKGALDQWGTPATAGVTPWRPTGSAAAGAMRAPSPVMVSPTAVEDYVAVEHTWSVPGGPHAPVNYDPKRSASTQILITEAMADSTADYFHAKYTVNGVTKYWMYRVGLGTHPSLDVLFDQPLETNGRFFPLVHFRSDGVSLINNKTSEAYKTSKKMVKYLGMDFDLVAEKIDENPDIGVIRQAMLTMAVPANTTNEMEQRYLFRFFTNQFYNQNQNQQHGSPTQGFIFGNLFRQFQGAKSAVVIQDAKFKMVLSNAGIYKRRISGSIGAINSHTSGTRTDVYRTTHVDLETGEPVITFNSVLVHYYRRQISAHLYDEVAINDLRMAYYIYDNYKDVGKGSENSLLIPLDHSITEDFSITDREELYSRSLHFVFNSLQIVKVKWYQSGWFKIFIQIVGIVLTVMTLGADGGFFATLAAGGAAALTAVVTALIVNYLVGLVISYALKLFVKLVGAELAFLIAIVAALAGAYKILMNGGLQGAPWAKELLQLSTGLTGAVSSNMQEKFGDLLADYESFNLFKTAEEKKLEEANKLLEFKNHLNPFVIFGESPNDFYNRTVHVSNPGVMSIGAISSYVDIALTLPKLDESIGANT